MPRWILCAPLWLALSATAWSQPATDSVRLDLVTYKQLSNEINSLRGKVVLVDFWADYCQPCKQKFPAVVALQRKYAQKGLSVVSVSVDDVTDAETRERVKAFLQQQRSTCRNLLLAEKPEVWIAKLKMNSIPSMFLFDRQGQLINRWTGNDIDLAGIEKRIVELLNSEPR
jgi:thiol-disulfide isomerase/thioredoxin